MKRKAVFFLAGVFLAMAIVVPTVILILQAESDVNNLINVQNQQNNPGHVTSGNYSDPSALQQSHQTNYLLVVIIEVVFITLFAVTLYYGIKQ